MISVRNLVTGIVLGAVVALLVHELCQFGLALGSWTFTGQRVGESLVTGASIGAASQLIGQSRGGR